MKKVIVKKEFEPNRGNKITPSDKAISVSDELYEKHKDCLEIAKEVKTTSKTKAVKE